MDLTTIKSVFWRRVAIVAWIIPGLLWWFLLEPLVHGARAFGSEFRYNLKVIRGLPTEVVQVWSADYAA